MITKEKQQIIIQTLSNLSSRGDFEGLRRYRELLLAQLKEEHHQLIKSVFNAAFATAGIAIVINSWGEIGREGRKMLEEVECQ